jgi:hypothetical protein
VFTNFTKAFGHTFRPTSDLSKNIDNAYKKIKTTVYSSVKK